MTAAPAPFGTGRSWEERSPGRSMMPRSVSQRVMTQVPAQLAMKASAEATKITITKRRPPVTAPGRNADGEHACGALIHWGQAQRRIPPIFQQYYRRYAAGFGRRRSETPATTRAQPRSCCPVG